MSLRVLTVLLRKELLDLLRDRRTIISLVLAPMLVGPALMASMNYYLKRSRTQASVQRFKVGLREDVAVPGLRDGLAAADLQVYSVRDPRMAVERKDVTFGIEVAGGTEKPVVRFYSDNSDMTASMARHRVNGVLDMVSRQLVQTELARRKVPAEVLEPFSRESVNIAQPRQMTGAFVGRLIGFLLLIFLFNGAMYAAVDSTAGEKERKTIEILLASAAGRTEIVGAKVLTALVTSFATTALSMTSYAFAFSEMTDGSSGPALVFATDPLTLTLLVLLILPVALFAASVCVAAASPARSAREAMTYLTPGMFVVMFLGMVTFVPGVEASTLMLFIPFANFSQMLRQVLAGEWSWQGYGLTLMCNVVYSGIAAALAIRNFASEKILFRT